MTARSVTALASFGASAVIVLGAAAVAEEAIPDAEALAIVHKHCVMCHAAKPTHAAFQDAPKNIALETLAGVKTYAGLIEARTVHSKTMPLGNETGMTEAERATLGRWIAALK